MKILTSWPAWAMMICHTSSNWGQYTIMTLLPKYLADYQGFNIKSSGWISGKVILNYNVQPDKFF
jgi:cyanate permease